MLHEIGHMFGLRHCIYFDCCMNGSNHLEENNKRAFDLCPICIRKLQHNIGFSLLERYEQVAKVCGEFGGPFQEAKGQSQQIVDLIRQAYGTNY